MFLVVVDAHLKWIEAVPTNQSCTSITTIIKLYLRGAAFTSAEFEDFMTKNGIRHLTTAPYHATSNGLAERAVQTVKQGLLKQTQGDLMAKLSRFLFNYRVTRRETTEVSPAELMFGGRLQAKLDLLQRKIEGRVQK